MKTIKLPIQNTINIDTLQRVYSSVVRFSYKRFCEKKTEKEIRALSKDKFCIGSWFIQCAIKHAEQIHKSQQSLNIQKIIFGSKNLFIKRRETKITKEDFKSARLMQLQIQGEKNQKGNRYFSFDIENNNQIIFKESKEAKQIIKLPKLRKNILRELLELERLAKNKEIAIQINLSSTYISFTFDETLLSLKLQTNENKILGIDLNPNYIGLSILNFDTKDEFSIVHKEVINLSKLNSKSSNKKQFELYQITRRIKNLAVHHKVSKIVLEDLNITGKNHKKGKKFNKLVNNDWCRDVIFKSLQKHCNIFGIQYTTVNAAYSSTVGNLLYGNSKTPDMIASSIEIARRGFKKFSKNWFYPSLELLKTTGNLWKEDLCRKFKTWIEIHTEIKNSKLKYRVQLSETLHDAVFRLDSKKSCVNIFLYSS